MKKHLIRKEKEGKLQPDFSNPSILIQMLLVAFNSATISLQGLLTLHITVFQDVSFRINPSLL